MHTIMIIEDDPTITQAIQTYLQSWQYQVVSVTDFERVLATFDLHKPDLVIIDISLPFFDGYHWCTEIRKHSNVPIIFLSSNSDNMNIIMAMNMGADDYVTKPFDLHVLGAKIQAIMRRTYNYTVESDTLEHRGLRLNVTSMEVSFDAGLGEETRELTKHEFKILEILMRKKGAIISREELMQHLWQTDDYIDANTLTVNVARLRKTLAQLGAQDYITTKKGSGYGC